MHRNKQHHVLQQVSTAVVVATGGGGGGAGLGGGAGGSGGGWGWSWGGGNPPSIPRELALVADNVRCVCCCVD